MSELGKKSTLKVIARPMGGLGNQLFCYAAARRLALVNQAELVMDTVTGFERDLRFNRKYSLNNFSISARAANRSERLEPFERYRRGLMKWLARKQPFEQRRYLEQEKLALDERLLNFRLDSTVYFEGYWQSERYFKDIEQTIRQDLHIIPPTDALNQQAAAAIQSCNAVGNSVALHVRWFDHPSQSANPTGGHNLATNYYKRAIDLIEQKLTAPHYVLFSDDPGAAREKIRLPENRVTFIDHNRDEVNAYADLWLMQQCQHFIIANSTFSWWGAWLSPNPHKIVITPDLDLTQGIVTAWGFEGLIPQEWLLV
jgi:hypothetical protein